MGESPLARTAASSKHGDTEYAAAIRIKEKCWQDDYAGTVPREAFCFTAELELLRTWMQGPASDLRSIRGAFLDGVLVGFAAASRADSTDSARGIEVNYLFVDGGIE